MKTYYNDALTKLSFENKALEIKDALHYFNELSSNKDSYIGFLDDFNEVIIFNGHGRNKWLVEHVVVSGILHRQRYVETIDAERFIEKVYQGKDIGLFKGFEDVPIGEFTLDEILAFKEDDNRVLREEDELEDNSVLVKPLTPQKKERTPNATTLTTPKKNKSQALQTLGERIKPKLETPKPNLNKIAEKLIKNKPTDDNSFFQI